MTAPPTVRVSTYESDPLVTFVERIRDDDTWSHYYELPADLVDSYEAATRALDKARADIEQHITDNNLTKIDPEEPA